jgi:molecular chaperone DnaJ
VPTLEGRATVPVPEGTQTGKTFRLRGQGIQGLRTGHRGDLYIHVIVETPVRLTDKQKKLLREFDESVRAGGDKHSPHTKSFMDRMKSFFTAD